MTIAFYSAFLDVHRGGVLTALAWLVPHEIAVVSARSVYTIQPCTMPFGLNKQTTKQKNISLHAKPYNLYKVHACLAVTCHLHFWQNDRDLLRAAAVTRGRNGYGNKSQHRKLSLEKKNSPAAPAGIRTRDLSVTSSAFKPLSYPRPKCRTRDRKILGSNPRRSGRRIFFCKVNVLCLLLFRYPFHPRVTAVARKRYRSFCQKCRWEVTVICTCLCCFE